MKDTDERCSSFGSYQRRNLPSDVNPGKDPRKDPGKGV